MLAQRRTCAGNSGRPVGVGTTFGRSRPEPVGYDQSWRTALSLAVQARQPALVQYLAREPDLDAKHLGGNTPFMEATVKAAIRVTGISLAMSADTPAENDKE